MNNSILNIDKSQAEKNSCKNISILNKNDKIEEEFPKDTDTVSFICKQPKVVTARCTEIVPSENTIEPIEIGQSENTVEPMEMVLSKNTIDLIETIMDVDKSQEDKNLCKEEETGNILQEQCEIHYNKEENQYKIINSTTENKVECEYITYLNTAEEKQLKENLISCTNETDKKVEDIFLQKFPGTSEEIYVEREMDDSENQEELINARDSPISFEEEINNWLD